LAVKLARLISIAALLLAGCAAFMFRYNVQISSPSGDITRVVRLDRWTGRVTYTDFTPMQRAGQWQPAREGDVIDFVADTNAAR
jgi:hypothetical protein